MNVADKPDDLHHPPVGAALEHLRTDTEPAPASVPVAPAHPPFEDLLVTQCQLQATVDLHVFKIIRVQQPITVIGSHRRLFLSAVAQHLGQCPITEQKIAGAHPLGITNINQVRHGTHNLGPELAALAQGQLRGSALTQIGDAHGNGMQRFGTLRQTHHHPYIQGAAVGQTQRRLYFETLVTVDQCQ